MRRIALLLLPLLAACAKPSAPQADRVDCAERGRPEFGSFAPLDCAGLVERRFAPLAAPPGPARPENEAPLAFVAKERQRELAREAAAACEARNRCELAEAELRARFEETARRHDRIRSLAARTRDRNARRALALELGLSSAPACEPPLQRCDDDTCAPPGASCCGDGTHCPTGACCGDGCCAEGEHCSAAGLCEPAPRCGGDWPVACPDGTCVPAGATCCGNGRFCRNGGVCCGESACCTGFEACVAGRCVPGATRSCADPARPVPCAGGSCIPPGGSCCGGGRICLGGSCCGEGACCLSGEICVEGRCVGPEAANPRCGGDWPVTCADGSCAPPGADCCGGSRYCAAGSTCCGDRCCLAGEICVEGVCIGP